MATVTESTAEKLGHLAVGARFWYWLCPQVSDGFPALVAQPLAEDPAMTALAGQTRDAPVPLGVVALTGLGHVDADGTLLLTSPLASAEHLAGLAAWVRATVGEHPDLSRLKNTALLNISAAGVVRAIHRDAGLWSGVPDAAAPGSLDETARRLSGLKPGRRCWFWLAQRGPGDAPFLYLHATRRDPDGEAFARSVLEFRRQATETGGELRGQLHRTAGGTLMFTTTDDISEGLTTCEALCRRHEGLRALLTGAVLAQSREGDFVQTALVGAASGGADLSAHVAVLEALKDKGDQALFWLGEVSGTPHLLLSSSRDDLKTAARALGEHGQSVRGSVVVSSRGWLEFRTRQPYASFIDHLAGWAGAHVSDWPALSRLRDARMTQRDDSGEIVDRQKNDDAWANL